MNNSFIVCGGHGDGAGDQTQGFIKKRQILYNWDNLSSLFTTYHLNWSYLKAGYNDFFFPEAEFIWVALTILQLTL